MVRVPPQNLEGGAVEDTDDPCRGIDSERNELVIFLKATALKPLLGFRTTPVYVDSVVLLGVANEDFLPRALLPLLEARKELVMLLWQELSPPAYRGEAIQNCKTPGGMSVEIIRGRVAAGDLLGTDSGLSGDRNLPLMLRPLRFATSTRLLIRH